MRSNWHYWYRLPSILVLAYFLVSTIGLSLIGERHLFPFDRWAMFGFRPNVEELFTIEVRDEKGRFLCFTPQCDGLLSSATDKSNLHGVVQGFGRAIESGQDVEIWQERLNSKFTKHFALHFRLKKVEWNWSEKNKTVLDGRGETLYEFAVPIRN